MLDSILEWVTLHRGRLQKMTLFATGMLPLAVIIVGFLFDDWKARRYLFFYVAPLLSVVSLWGWYRLGNVNHINPTCLTIDGIVIALAGLRFLSGALPYSGHMLFLAYSGIVEPSFFYRSVALIVLIETSYFKW